MLKRLLLFISCILCAVSVKAGIPTGATLSVDYSIEGAASYYVATDGSDSSGDGSISNPWQSLAYAMDTIPTGNSVIYLRGGNYGRHYKLSQDGWGNTGWVTVKPYPGEEVIFTSFELSFDGRYYPTNFRVDGIKINMVNDTYLDVFLIRGGENIDIRNMVVTGYDRFVGGSSGINISSANNVLIYHNEITNISKGIQTSALSTTPATGLTISENKIYHLSGSTPISYGAYLSNAVISRNNLYDSIDDRNIPIEEKTHGSCVSIRSGDIIVKENYCRNMGSSSGVMLYTDTGTPTAYSNIYFYNNVFYDIYNQYIIRLYRIGENIEIKNNTIVGSLMDAYSGSWKLSLPIAAHSYGDSYDGSGVVIANNILAGRCILPDLATVTGNIMYSVSLLSAETNMLSELSGNIVLTNDTDEPVDYFTSEFFSTSISLAMLHGQQYTMQLHPASTAKLYGDNPLALTTSIGDVGEGGFVSPPVSTTARKSSGAREYIMPKRLFRNVRVSDEVEP